MAGAVVIAAAIGFLIKKYNKGKADPYEANPFDKDEFRRESVMLPEGFESDDGHRSMTEHNNYGRPPSSGYDDAYASASANVIGGAAYSNMASSAYTHNESGGPRPPTMFARHNDIHAGAPGPFADGPRMPAIGAALNTAPTPQLPPMAFGGGDPYSLAGVGGGLHNVSNPYAHLDRNGYMHNNAQYQDVGAPVLQRNGSGGSGEDRGASRRDDGFETSGRPGTSEGRSGTPDIPNVQQTYALGSDEGHSPSHSNRQSAGASSLLDSYGSQRYEAGAHASPAINQYQDEDQYQQHYGGASSPPPPSALQVRNLTHGAQGNGNNFLNPSGHGVVGGQQRPLSNASSMVDDDAAYGGVY